MKTLFTLLLVAGVIHSAPALANPLPPATSVPSPLLGSWSVDVTRLPVPAEARPTRVTITFSDSGGGKWSMQVAIVDAGGSQSTVQGTYTLDGSTVPIQGTIEADVGAMKKPESNVLVLALGKGGGPASTRIYTVNPDGESMIETAVNTAGNGLPMMRTNYFSRVK
ncbi:MAG: hypothetical protein ABI843_17835 [Dokdonella sp.]